MKNIHATNRKMNKFPNRFYAIHSFFVGEKQYLKELSE